MSASDGFATTQYDVDVTGNGFTSFTFDAGGETRVLVRPNGSTDWTDPIPGVHVNGTGNEVQRDNITTALNVDLAIGDITGCPTINTSAITGDVEVCLNETGVVYSVVDEGSTYNWAVTGGSIIAGQGSASVTIDWGGTGGEYQVQVTEDNGCAVGSPVVLDVNLNPIPAGTISGNLSVAEGAVGEVYSIPNRTGYSYVWSTSDGTINGSSTSSSVNIDWTGTGTGTLTLTVSYDNAVAECGGPTADEVINQNITFFSQFESVASGNYSNPSTWDCSCVPPANANIIVRNPDDVSMDSDVAIRDLTIENGASFDNNNFVLTLNGNYTNNGTHISTNRSDLNVDGSVISGTGTISGDLFRIQSNSSSAGGASLTVSSTFRIRSDRAFTNQGTMLFQGDVEGGNAAARMTNASGALLNFQGTNFLSTGSLTANATNNQVNYSALAAQNVKSASGAPAEYYNLQMLGSGDKTLLADLGVGNDLTINGGNLVSNGFDISIDGNWNNQSNSFDEGTATVSFTGSGTQTITNSGGSETFHNLEINNTSIGQGVVGAAGNTINVNNQLVLTNGFISPTASEPLILSNSASVSGGAARVM